MVRLLQALQRQCSGLFSVTLLACLLACQGMIDQSKVDVNFNSLKSIRAHISRLRSELAKDPDGGAGPSDSKKEEKGGLDYLDALEWYLSIRAYPYDTIDWDAMLRALDQRDRMGAGQSMSGPFWEFLGPTNCTPPYQWAYGPGKINGRINSAAFDPSPLSSTIYAASASGGAWRSLDGGAHWSPLGDGWSTLPTNCVAVDPSNPQRIYVGTGDFDGWGGYCLGIMRSLDGGQTWTNVGNAEFGRSAVRRILVDPDNSLIVTAVTGRGPQGAGQVWRSTDGGSTWNAVIAAAGFWSDIQCGAKDANGNRTYYAAMSGMSEQVWTSTDRGATWTKLTTPLRTNASSLDTVDVACSPTNPSAVYLLGTGDRKVWKSLNAGTSWIDVTSAALSNANWGQAWYDFYISCSSNGPSDVLYVGLIDVLRSTDGGSNWFSFIKGYTGSDLAHVDEHDYVVDPRDPAHALLCSDGGVYDVQSGLGTPTISSLNAYLGVTEFYHADWHPTDGTRMIGGSQDNGTPTARGDIANWSAVTGGDGGAALINQSNPDVQYSTYQFFGGSGSGGTIGVNRTTNNWSSSSWVSVNVGTDKVGWMGPIEMAANNSGILYVGTNYLWKYNDSNNTWSPRLGNQKLSPSSTILSIGVSKHNDNSIYTGSGDGQLWMTQNAGTNWTQINTGAISLPNRAITAVQPRDDNEKEVLVGVSGTGTSHVWRCLDTTAGSNRTWIDVSGTGGSALPNVPVNSIAIDPDSPGSIWYVGTDIGVFKTTDAGSTWLNITQPAGLPNTAIAVLRIRNGYLYAASYGRGMWRISLTGGGGGVTVTALGFNPTEFVGPGTSTGTVTLSGPAPQGGAVVALSSGNPAIVSVPSSVTVPQGQTQAGFTANGTAVPTQTIVNVQASLNGSAASATLTVDPNGLTNIQLSKYSIPGGDPVQGTVTISSPAPQGGAVVQLSSSQTNVATVPASVTIPYNQQTANFTVTTYPTTTDTQSTIKATLGTSSVQTVLTVRSPSVATFVVNPDSVVGGSPSTGTVTLDGKAPSGGSVVALQSSDPAATLPSSVTVSAGAKTASFTVNTKVVTADTGVTLTATLHGQQRFANLLVKAQKLLSVTFVPNPVVGGNSVAGTVALAGVATNNLTVQLSSSNTTLATVPSSIVIYAGRSTGTFTVTTKQVLVDSPVDIYATAGTSTISGTLTLQPLRLIGFTVTPSAAFEKQLITGKVSLNGNALSGGATVTLSNSNPLAATVPTSVIVPQGSSSKTFTFYTATVTTSQSTTITAKRGNSSISQTLIVNPITIQSLQLAYGSVIGGATVGGIVRLAHAAPSGGYLVKLTSSNTTAATVPVSVTIPQGGTSATFTVTTKPVPGTTFVTITGTHGASSATAGLQVLPPEVSSFRLSTYTVKGGTNITGTVILTGRAPTGGIAVNVWASPNLAWPSAPVKVAQGANSVSFTVKTSLVTQQTSVQVFARTLNIAKAVTLTLKP